MQLKHNVHEQPGDMTNLQIEHLSEHSQVFQDFMISDSPDVRADDSTERTRLQDSGLRSSGIGHTVNPLGTGHTGNGSDREHSVRRSGSVRSDAMEHGSDRTRHCSDVSRSSRRDSITHRQSISHCHTDPGEPFQASLLRHRVRICSALRTLSFRDIIVVSSLAQERRRSHIRRGNSLPLLVLLLTAFPSLHLEKEKGNGTCLKKKHITLRSFNMTTV